MLGAACAASLKLFLVCVGIGWLLTEGHLPAETAPVLSKARVSKCTQIWHTHSKHSARGRGPSNSGLCKRRVSTAA